MSDSFSGRDLVSVGIGGVVGAACAALYYRILSSGACEGKGVISLYLMLIFMRTSHLNKYLLDMATNASTSKTSDPNHSWNGTTWNALAKRVGASKATHLRDLIKVRDITTAKKISNSTIK